MERKIGNSTTQFESPMTQYYAIILSLLYYKFQVYHGKISGLTVPVIFLFLWIFHLITFQKSPSQNTSFSLNPKFFKTPIEINFIDNVN